MRIVVQRVIEASVKVNEKEISKIGTGLLILLGVAPNDSQEDIEWLAKKVVQLRIFPNEDGNMNKSVVDINAEVIVVSQFTLYASTKKGNRPSFTSSAKPEIAEPLYKEFVNVLEAKLNKKVGTGVFGAAMEVSLINDGPITICIDSKNRE